MASGQRCCVFFSIAAMVMSAFCLLIQLDSLSSPDKLSERPLPTGLAWSMGRDGSRLSLQDSSGRPRLVLAVSRAGVPHVGLLDAAGNRRAALELRGGPRLICTNHRGRTSLLVGTSYGGDTSVVLCDDSGAPRITADLSHDGPRLWFTDAAQMPQLVLETIARPRVVVFDEKLGERLALTVASGGRGQILFRNREGVPRLALGFSEEANLRSRVALLNPDGDVFWQR